MNIQKNVSLKEFNTFGVDKIARYYVRVHSGQDVVEALAAAKKLDIPIFILGGGSNILLTRDVEALVIHMYIKGIENFKEDDNHRWLRVGAGEVWHDFVLRTISEGLAGIENLSLIPGTVGASPMQNIGAYGVEVQEVFEHLEAVDINSLETRIFDHASCRFGYRESVFKREAKGRYVITRVVFRLNKNPSYHTEYGDLKVTLQKMGASDLSLEAVSNAVIHIRQSKLPDPKIIGNAGSFFKNPIVPRPKYEQLQTAYPEIPGYADAAGVKIPAAWLLEKAGWKGKTIGDIGVHKHHPLVLVNYGKGEGSSIQSLSQQIQADINNRFGILLTPEVNII